MKGHFSPLGNETGPPSEDRPGLFHAIFVPTSKVKVTLIYSDFL